MTAIDKHKLEIACIYRHRFAGMAPWEGAQEKPWTCWRHPESIAGYAFMATPRQKAEVQEGQQGNFPEQGNTQCVTYASVAITSADSMSELMSDAAKGTNSRCRLWCQFVMMSGSSGTLPVSSSHSPWTWKCYLWCQHQALWAWCHDDSCYLRSTLLNQWIGKACTDAEIHILQQQPKHVVQSQGRVCMQALQKRQSTVMVICH